jgi:predicted small lipoprotein YifL
MVGHVSGFAMILPASARLRALATTGLLVVALAACGRRGALEPPPDPTAAIAAPASPARPAAPGAATAGQTRVPPLAQAARSEGTTAPPDDDDDDDQPSIIRQPVPAPKAAGSGRRRGYVIPKEPFILDPLL